MNNVNRKILVPQYMQKFKCIGSACEDTCCAGWRVTIDEKTYKHYKNTNESEIKDLLREKVKRNRSNANEQNYAKILLDKQGSCPFLTGDKLCKIQQKLGFEALSITCAVYPRLTREVNGVMERSATLSCPEIARLVLLNPEPMEFDEIEENVPDIFRIEKKIDTYALSVSNKPERYFWELRIFTIQLLQNRKFKLWERLVILGLFYQKLQIAIDENKVKEIPELIAKYINMINSDVFENMLNDIPAQINIQMKLLKELTDIRVIKGVSSKRYMESLGEFLVGIKYTKEATVEEVGERYKEAYSNYYEPYMREKEYILENYLVNYVFKNTFPLSGEKNLFDNYVMLIIHYALIKMHLIGISGFQKENFNTDHIIKLVQSLAKTFEHNNSFLKQLFDLLKGNEFVTMAHMAILIKN